jgi:hypothetical protein
LGVIAICLSKITCSVDARQLDNSRSPHPESKRKAEMVLIFRRVLLRLPAQQQKCCQQEHSGQHCRKPSNVVTVLTVKFVVGANGKSGAKSETNNCKKRLHAAAPVALVQWGPNITVAVLLEVRTPSDHLVSSAPE